MTNLVEIPKIAELKQNLSGMSKTEIQNYAKRFTRGIIEKIKDVSEQIEDAKRLSGRAHSVESDLRNRFSFGIFGKSKTDKRSEINTEAISLHNKALSAMNDLIQGSVALTTCSTIFTETMVETIASAMKDGFQDQYGYQITLSDAAKEQAQILLSHAEEALQREGRIEANTQAISEVKDQARSNTQKIGENASKIGENFQNIKENARNVSSNAQKIEELQKELSKFKAQNTKIALYVSILAMFLSMVALILTLKF